jgi:hypothetical protein
MDWTNALDVDDTESRRGRGGERERERFGLDKEKGAVDKEGAQNSCTKRDQRRRDTVKPLREASDGDADDDGRETKSLR